ncbi:MAG: DUF4198 domain-containing protein [Desulfobacteraceae bacterium]|nr:DUF4198 domain-containing protein [Desulfobacteraceae bacterium]
MKKTAILKAINRCLSPGGLLAIASCLFFASSALGHTLYIQSSRYNVHEGKKFPLFFCYGHHIPVSDGVRAKKLNNITVHAPSGKVKKMKIRDETSLHSYMVDYDTPGTYVLTAETNPGYYTIYIDKKGREHHVIKPKNLVKDKARKIITSLYCNQYTKTYVVCDTPSRNFPARVGLALELVPTKDISTLKPGETLELSVWSNGKPYKGEGYWDASYNGYSTEAEDMFYKKTTLTNGETLKIPIPKSGRWFIRYSTKTDAKGEVLNSCNQLKQAASLVFEL